MRGLRFSNDGINPPAGSWYGSLTLDDLGALAPAMRRLGWHAQVHGRCDYLVARVEQWLASGLTIVFDHTGRPDVERGVGDRSFQAFLSLLREGPFFVKLTPGRLSNRYPDYGDVRPFFEALAKAAPDQLLFGSDWPFFGEDDAMPDAGRLVDLVDAWLPDAELRRKIFVANPERLFGGVRRAADDGGAGEAAPARACSD